MTVFRFLFLVNVVRKLGCYGENSVTIKNEGKVSTTWSAYDPTFLDATSLVQLSWDIPGNGVDPPDYILI